MNDFHESQMEMTCGGRRR